MPQQNSDAENDWHRRLLRAWGQSATPPLR
jgi:hypothetical protein